MIQANRIESCIFDSIRAISWHGHVREFADHESCCSSWSRNCKNTFCIWDVSSSGCEAMIIFWITLGTNRRCIDTVCLWFFLKSIPWIPGRNRTPNSAFANVGKASHLDVCECTHQVHCHFFHAIGTSNTNTNCLAVLHRAIRAVNIRRWKIHRRFPEQNNQWPVAWTLYWTHFRIGTPVRIQWNRQTSMNWNSNLWPAPADRHQLNHHIESCHSRCRQTMPRPMHTHYAIDLIESFTFTVKIVFWLKSRESKCLFQLTICFIVANFIPVRWSVVEDTWCIQRRSKCVWIFRKQGLRFFSHISLCCRQCVI